MKIQPITKLISYASKASLCKSSGIVSMPVIKQAFGDKFELATGFIGNSRPFAKPDKSFEPEFLRKLLKIEGKTDLETYSMIKDEILKAMGFKHPEALKIIFSKSTAQSEYVFTLGQIKLCSGEGETKERLIASIRHELEHMLQSVKIYKAKGKESFAEAMLARQKSNGIVPNETVEDVIKRMKLEFFETMEKDVSIEGFDVERYYKALCEGIADDGSLGAGYKYYSNLLEKDAYLCTRKVLRALGQNSTIIADIFPANYKNLLELLKNKGIHEHWYEDILNELVIFARIKEAETPENFKKFLKICKDGKKGVKLTQQDQTWALKRMKKIKNLNLLEKMGQKPSLQVETWLKENKFTIEDILGDI